MTAKNKTSLLPRLATASALASLTFTAHAADHAATSSLTPAQWQKPAWLTDLSVGVKECYDDNVFMQGIKNLPAYTVPSGSVAALRNQSSWITTVSPKIGFNFAPLLANQDVLQTLSLAYQPNFTIYHDESSESYNAHRFLGALKGSSGAFTFNVSEALSYVDGSNVGPTYPGNFISAYNVAFPRERREQIQNRASAVLQYSWDKCFVRPTASLAYYDLMTRLMSGFTGYQNYADRYDVNGGADFGYNLNKQVALTLGYRYGHQYQQQFNFTSLASSSDYQRVLLGVEGKPLKWLTVKIQAGPDFRNYEAAAPVSDQHRVTYYGEASLTATLSPKDAVTLKYKGWQWVSSTGKVPYFDSTYHLTYHHKLTDKLGLDLGGRLLTADYTMGNLAPCKRNDALYTVSAGLSYIINSHASLSAAYAFNMGRSFEAGPGVTENQFNQHLVALSCMFKF